MAKITVAFLVALSLSCQPARSAGQDLYDETVLRTLELEFSQANWWQQLTSNYQAKQNIAATLTVDGVIYEGVGVRFRGNTSYMMTGNSQKKSFNIEIDYTIEDQRLMGYKTLNLINCANDATFMREVLYSNTCRRQIPSAKANFVKLVINGDNWGIYANIQQLNAEFIEDWFPSNDGTRWRAEGRMGMGGGGQTTGGDQTTGGGGRPLPNQNNLALAEPGGGGGGGFGDGSAALTWQGSDLTVYEQVYELKSTKQDDPWASLINTCDVLNNTPLDQLPDVLDTVLNVDRALWLCAFEVVFQDEDGYLFKRGSDYYIYYEPETGRLHLMQYDGNECMGTQEWSLFYRVDDPLVPLMYRLMFISQYRQRYLAHVRTILDSFLTEDTLWPKIDAYQALIEQEVQMDNKKLYTTQAFLGGITALKTFIQRRRATLLANRVFDQAIPEILSVDYDVIQEQAGQSLVITAQLGQTVPVADVQLFLSEGTYGPFTALPMVLDGESASDSNDAACYTITLQAYPPGTVLRYYVQATAADGVGTLVFSPAGAEHDVYTYVVTYAKAEVTPVVINEIMARNNTTIADPQGEYDDWIELFNISDETVDLSGVYLSDNPENPLKWKFPKGTTIDPGGYIIVWADENGSDEPGLHANFKLSSQGETLWLYDTNAHNNALLDTVSFEALQADQSMGRVPDGQGSMQILPVPSPLGPNAGSVVTMADDDADG